MKNTNIKKGFFGVKYYYLDDVTRIRYGLSFKNLGIAYTLERKGKCFWNEVAWTYPKTHRNSDMQHIIEYLQWKEQTQKNESNFISVNSNPHHPMKTAVDWLIKK